MASARLTLLIGAVLLSETAERIAGQTEATDATTPEESWWRTTPFASLPSITTQQVIRSILLPDAVTYSPVSNPDESGSVLDYVSAFKSRAEAWNRCTNTPPCSSSSSRRNISSLQV